MNLLYPDIAKLIPQKFPFIMVDECVAFTDSSTESSFTVRADNVLVESGYFTAYGLIENMAQTAAILSGMKGRLSEEKPKTGFIGTINDAKIIRLPAIGSTLSTIVQQTTQVLNIIVIQASCYCKNELLAQCQMKIVLMDDF